MVCEYGFEEAAPAKLLRMARNMILLRPQEYNEKLLACCIHVFDEGKYDENVLAYLEQFYQAKSDKMMKVWRARKFIWQNSGSFYVLSSAAAGCGG